MDKIIAIAPPKGKGEYEHYSQWLEAEGFKVVKLQPGDDASKYDALVLTGGADLGLQPERDQNEFAWFKQCYGKIPVVGICRGMQLANVALGGTLWDDLGEELFIKHTVNKELISEEVGTKFPSSWHEVVLVDENFSLLESTQDEAGPLIKVNSRHHQGVKDLAEELTTVAVCADDKLVEAAGNDNCMLVQWHPEKPEVRDLECSEIVITWLKSKA